MSWKKFLKPNIWKVLLGIILFLSLTYVGLDNLEFCKGPCPASSLTLKDVISAVTLYPGFIAMWVLGFLWTKILGLSPNPDILILLSFAVLALYYYVISCLIFGVISKYKKRV